MSLDMPRRSMGGRLGELGLWTSAAVLVLAVHIGGATYLMRDDADAPAENGPPAAIMIDLAPEPEAANTEQDQISQDTATQEEVKTGETEPVPDPPPEPVEQPTPEPPPPEPAAEAPVEPPPPEEMAEAPEPTPPDPLPEPAPLPDPPPVAENIPEPPPEPVEQPDPIEEQVTAALDNVEVPLPVSRPPPPVEKAETPKKPEPKKQRQVRQQQQQVQKETAEAKLQTKQADRTAASQTSVGSIFSSASPAQWMSRVRAKIARNARRCPGGDKGIVAISFSFDGSGNIGRVSVARSSGNAEIDEYVQSAVRRASPIPTPPSGVASSLTQSVECQ